MAREEMLENTLTYFIQVADIKHTEADYLVVKTWFEELTHKLKTMYPTHLNYNFNNDYNWFRVITVIKCIIKPFSNAARVGQSVNKA